MESIEIFPDNLVESEPQQIKKTLLVLRWLGLIFLIAALLFGCSWISLYGTRSTPSMDTGSLLKADYSPWDFLVFQPVDPAIMEEIENDLGEPVLEPDLKTGNLGLGAIPTPIPTQETLTELPTNTPTNVPSSSATPSPTILMEAPNATAMATPIPTSTNTSAPAITNTLAPTITNKPANTNTPKPAKTKKPKPTRNPNYTPNP